MLFLTVSAASLFTFIAVAAWSDARRREREAFYKSETLKKVAESPAGASVLELIREEHRLATARRRDGLKLGGLINIAAGIGLLVFLRLLVRDEALFAVGLIPMLIGVALLVHVYLLAGGE
jgi:ferric-dicitrate binding protein FerR (iron transport regulator)